MQFACLGSSGKQASNAKPQAMQSYRSIHQLLASPADPLLSEGLQASHS
jgi:hypothetical protein